MGLRNGVYTILERLQYGLYNRLTAHDYTIYVDGELMRYKGMVDTNLSLHNACEEIAKTSFAYMMGMIRHIEEMMSPFKPNEIIVYMDGEHRIANKIVRSSSSRMNVDIKMVRGFFIKYCEMSNSRNMRVENLKSGESELQMYLNRKRENNVNIFLTSDSDMITILYGHEPIGCTDKLSTQIDDDDVNYRISSKNKIYTLLHNDIRDSCLWINCNNRSMAIGCDFSHRILRLNKLHFRTFTAICGTDFTQNLLTETMIKAVLDASDEDITLINRQSTLENIIKIIMFIGMKNGGTLKPMKRYDCQISYSLYDYIDNVKFYLEYIENGIMTEKIFTNVDTSTLCRNIFNELGYPSRIFRKSQLVQWCRMKNLNDFL